MTTLDRRTFLRTISVSSSAIVLAPLFTACGSETTTSADEALSTTSGTESTTPDPLAIPRVRPSDWDPIAFNRTRGHAGAIPESYWPQIDSAEGPAQHLGKHLPYVPDTSAMQVPAGMIALMWGDPSRGYAKHPNAVRNESNQMQGHWYNWIEVRKATSGEAATARSEYPEWPDPESPNFAVLGGGDITADAGKNTVYLAALPGDVRPGDLVRIHAHCLTHGEYVDFLVVPG